MISWHKYQTRVIRNLMGFWLITDWPLMCLADQRRPLALSDTINRAVRPGAIVFEGSAGSGILSFFAARAGVKSVIEFCAVQILATRLNDVFGTGIGSANAELCVERG